MNQYQYEVGDIVKLKKPHPCGSHEWEILRVGADFPPEMHWLWTSDDGDTQACGKEYKRLAEAGIKCM